MKSWLYLSAFIIFHFLACIFFENMSFLPFWLFAASATLLCFYIVEKFNFSDIQKKLVPFFIICLALPCLNLTPDDDIHRYFWEAKVLLNSHNPYKHAPNSHKLKELYKTFSIGEVNHPEWTSIYGPVFQYFMIGIVFFGGSITSVKFLWLILHLFNTWLIKRCSMHEKAWIAYGLSSFIMIETIGLGHMEQVLITGVLLLIYGIKHFNRTFFTIGAILSMLVKWWLIPFLPIIFKRKFLKTFILMSGISLLLCLPFLDREFNLFRSLFAFSGLWSHGYLYKIIDFFLGDATRVCISLLLIARAIQLFFTGGRLSYQLLALIRWGIWLSPTIHPWYLVLPLVLCLIEGQYFTFAFVAALSFGMHDAEFHLFHHGEWVTSRLYGLPAFIAFFIPEHTLRRIFLFEHGPLVQQFTVVTPALNEEKNIKELGEQIQRFKQDIEEWIVVDGCSEDNSCLVATEHGAKLIQAKKKGRGHQIRQGVEASKNDWVVVIHCDTRITEHFFNDLRRTIHDTPGLVGGAFKMSYRNHQHLGPLQFLNAFKTYFLGLSFGDQSQFIKRSELDRYGGFPDIPLMEDVEISLLWQGQTTAFIKTSQSLTSPRRWKEKGRLRNSLNIIHILLRFFFIRQIFEKVDTQKLYKKYYG